MNVYKENGYKNRDDYLRCMSEDYMVDIDTTKALADLLGPSGDFGPLVGVLRGLLWRYKTQVQS